jgi:hypothetical protein
MLGFGKSKQETWTGVATRKGQGTIVDEDGERTIYYTLDVKRRDNGKDEHYVVGRGQVSPKLFNSLDEGDKVIKPEVQRLSKGTLRAGGYIMSSIFRY